jgi:hypothetical protein
MKIHTGARISPAEAGLVLIQLSQGPAAANQIPDSSENRFVLKPDVRQQSTQHPVKGVASKKPSHHPLSHSPSSIANKE